jgi:dimethylargininase
MIRFKHAITRLPGENFTSGLTTSFLGAASYPLILEQHAAYVTALRGLGLEVTVLPAETAYPDAYFVEDPAIVTAKVAIITRPGAPSRQGEEVSLAPVLAQHRPLERIYFPGSVDGGDILMVEDHFFIGVSERTNATGAEQLSGILNRHGYTFELVQVGEGLHLKSSVNWLGGERLVVTQALADHPAFKRFEKLVVDAEEEYAANTLWVNGTLLYPKGFPRTRSNLEKLGVPLIELDVSEVRKMDGGLTCMSLRFG